MLALRLRAMGAPHWLALFGLILAAWGVLFVMAAPGGVHGGDMWSVTAGDAGWLRLWMMWAVMSAAMMAPTVIPALATYDDLSRAGGATSMARLVAGYLLVWVGFSALAAGAQVGLFRAGLADLPGQDGVRWLTAVLLAAAGLYQFSPLKAACVSKCRAPLTFFMAHWDEGPWRNGLRLGLVCLGCCWVLMMLGLVGGAVSLGFMGLATLLMIVEKLPEIGGWITRPLGALLMMAAGVVAFGLT